MTNRPLNEEVVFHIARDLSDTEKRAAYLDQVCAGDGKRPVTASQKGEIQFWNPESGQLVGQFHVNDQVRRIYFLPGDEGFITAATGGNIRVWKLKK